MLLLQKRMQKTKYFWWIATIKRELKRAAKHVKMIDFHIILLGNSWIQRRLRRGKILACCQDLLLVRRREAMYQWHGLLCWVRHTLVVQRRSQQSNRLMSIPDWEQDRWSNCRVWAPLNTVLPRPGERRRSSQQEPWRKVFRSCQDLKKNLSHILLNPPTPNWRMVIVDFKSVKVRVCCVCILVLIYFKSFQIVVINSDWGWNPKKNDFDSAGHFL